VVVQYCGGNRLIVDLEDRQDYTNIVSMTLVEGFEVLVFLELRTCQGLNAQPLRAGAFPQVARPLSGSSHPGDALGIQLQSIVDG